MPPLREEWKRHLPGCVLLFSLMVPAQVAAAFLVQGCWGVFGGQLFGFPAMGIEPLSGATAAWAGALLILLGLLCSWTTFALIRYAYRESRKMWPRS